MIEKLLQIIKYHSESVHVDFKSQQYPLGKNANKNEILKDISSMANHPSDDVKYILIGVKEKDGVASEFIDINDLTDQAKYQQFIEENIEPKINFKYFSFEYDGHKLAAFIISNNHDRPYLFKRDIRKLDSGAQEFRIGDGYIRTGTSTRKLSRKDLEDIYLKKYEAKDRKLDLKITPILTEYLSVDGDNYPLKYIIDFSIENLSKKSIGFEAELKLYYKKGVGLHKKFKFENSYKDKGLAATYPHYFHPKIDSTIFDLQFEELEDSYKITRIRRVNEKYAVTISQNNHEKNIFLNEILVAILTSKNRDSLVSLELTFRSDEFRDGPLVKSYEFDLNKYKTVPNNG